MRIGKGATVGQYAANAVVASQPPLPFSDSFSPTSPAGPPSDGSQLSRSWTDQNGNVTIVGGKAKGTAGTNLSTVNGKNINVADVTVTANVNVPVGSYAGLVARYSGPLESNMYAGFLSSVAGGFQASIWINVGGAWTLLASSSTTVSSGTGQLQFQTIGTTLNLFFQGQQLVSATDSQLISGSVGMRMGLDATIDSFSAS